MCAPLFPDPLLFRIISGHARFRIESIVVGSGGWGGGGVSPHGRLQF